MMFGCNFRYVEAEKTNARWAMMAVAGILFTEALGFAPKWFNVGYESIGDYPLPALVAVQALVMGAVETKRLTGFKETGKVCRDVVFALEWLITLCHADNSQVCQVGTYLSPM